MEGEKVGEREREKSWLSHFSDQAVCVRPSPQISLEHTVPTLSGTATPKGFRSLFKGKETRLVTVVKPSPAASK